MVTSAPVMGGMPAGAMDPAQQNAGGDAELPADMSASETASAAQLTDRGTQSALSPVAAQTDGEVSSAGQSLQLNGRGYGTIENGDPIDFASGSTLTVEFWVKPDADSDENAWIMRQGGSWGVQWTGTGDERQIFFKADDFTQGVTSNDGVPAGEWTHVAIVYDGSNRNVYLDGELDKSAGGSDTPNTNNNRVRFGSNDAANGQFFVGQVDNVRFWNTDRNLIGIQNDQFAELDGTESGLDQLYQFDSDASDGPATDAAGSSDITLTGDAEIVDGDSNPAPPYVHARPENGSVVVDLTQRFDPAGQNDPTEYRLYRSTSPDPDTASLVTTLQPPTTSYTDTEVSNGQQYFYWTTAVDGDGEGGFSKAASASPFGKTGESVEVGPNGGQGGGSLALDGRSWATLADRASVDRATGSELAIEFWVKPDADSDEDAWIMRKQGSWGVQWTGSGEERQIFFQADDFNSGITSNDGVQAGVWTHVAVVYDGSNRNIYLDGELDKSNSGADGPETSGNDLVIGSNGANNDQFFTGQIDDLRFWENPRGSSQVEENYTAELVGSESGLVGYWKFDTSEGSGEATRGSTYRHGTVTLNSNAQISEGGAYPVGTDTYVHSRNGNATVTWSVRTVSTPEEFAVWRKNASADESGWELVERIEDRSARSYVDESASNGANYHYAVTTTNKDLQESDFSRGAPARPYEESGGGALSLDGAQDTRGLVTDRPSLGVVTNDEFTIEFWVKPDADSDDNAWIMRKQGAWGVQWTGSGEERQIFFKADGFNDEITSNGGVQAGVWTHVAVVYDGNNRNVYLNGELDKRNGGSDSPGTSGNDLSIGANDAGNDRYFDGRIDEVAFWDDARTSDQLEATYNDRLTGNETDLRHYWQFDEQGADASRSTTRRHATVDVQGQAAVESPGAMPVTPRVYARADDGSADVSWRVRNLAETTDVGIYRSSQRNLGDRSRIATVDADTETRYTDAGLSNGQTRFYQTTAFNTDGQESDYAFEAGALPSEQIGGNAFRLTGNGTSSYGTLTDRASIDNSIGDRFAVEFWVNPDADSDDNAYIMRKQGAWGVQWTGTGDARQIRFQADGFNDGITSDSNVPADEWTHVAVVYDGSNRNVYLDGQLDKSNSGADGPGTSGNDLRIGVNGATNGQFFKGEVDEIRIWDDPRSDIEVRRNYNNELSGSGDDLIGYWRGPFTTDNESVTGNARKPMTLGLNNVGPVDSNAPVQPGGVDTTTVDVALECAPDGLIYYQIRLNATSGEPIRSIESGPEFGGVSTLEGGPGTSSVTAAGEFSASETTFTDRRVLFSVEYEGVVNETDTDLTVESLRGGDGEITSCDVTADVGEPQSPGDGDGTGDLGFAIELPTQRANVSQGGSVDITTSPRNKATQAVSNATLELQVDQNGDGQFGTGEAVASKQVDFDAGEKRNEVLTYSNVSLASGEYSYQARISKNGQTNTSFTTGTLTVTDGDGTGDLDVEFVELQQDATVTQGGSADIQTASTNNGDQSVSGTLELVVDQDGDGQFASDESVASKSVTIPTNVDSLTFETLTYSDVGLAAGNYSYKARFSSGGQTVTSTSTGTLTVQAGDEPDVGIELQSEATVARGGSVDIDTFPNNRADQSVSGTLELVVDQNGDGQFGTGEVVASRTVTLAADASTTETLTYSDVGLAPGEYTYQAQLRSGGQTVTSFTTSTLTVEGGEPRLVLEPQSASTTTNATTTLDLVLTNADGGVGTYENITVSVGDTSVASITDVSDATGAGASVQTVAADGSSATIAADFGGDTADTGNVTVATVTLDAAAAGTTTLDVSLDGAVFNESGPAYTLAEVRGGQLTVREGGPEILPGTPAEDTNGDGLLDDFNGNGAIDRGDAQALFANLGTQRVSENTALLDYNGNNRVDRGDVQALFQAALQS